MPTGKLNKNGKPKYKTKKYNYNCVPAEECKQKLDGIAKNYLLHRFDATNDKFVWPLIMEECKEIEDVIVRMDYSENLKEKPKLEVQLPQSSGERQYDKDSSNNLIKADSDFEDEDEDEDVRKGFQVSYEEAEGDVYGSGVF